MTTSALTFEEKVFNSQKELLITLLEASKSDYLEFDLHEDLNFLPSFKAKFHGYNLACITIYHRGSIQHSYFLNLQCLLSSPSPLINLFEIPFSEFIEILLREAKK